MPDFDSSIEGSGSEDLKQPLNFNSELFKNIKSFRELKDCILVSPLLLYSMVEEPDFLGIASADISVGIITLNNRLTTKPVKNDFWSNHVLVYNESDWNRVIDKLISVRIICRINQYFGGFTVRRNNIGDITDKTGKFTCRVIEVHSNAGSVYSIQDRPLSFDISFHAPSEYWTSCADQYFSDTPELAEYTYLYKNELKEGWFKSYTGATLNMADPHPYTQCCLDMAKDLTFQPGGLQYNYKAWREGKDSV